MSTELVNIKGLGELPETMRLAYEEIDITLPNQSNKHNEAKLGLECKEETGFNDKFTVNAQATKQGYVLDVSFKSEVSNALFSKGTMAFSYNSTTQQWRMTGIAFNRQWAFCDSEAAFDLLTTSLECYINNDETDKTQAGYMDLLVSSLISQRSAITDNALLYKEEADCTAQPTDRADPYSEGAVYGQIPVHGG
jgi:hypothetical protein